MKALLLLFSRSVMSDSLLILWAVAFQAPLAMGFPRQEYWNELPFPSAGDLPNPRTELKSLASLALAGWFFTTVTFGKPPLSYDSRHLLFTLLSSAGVWPGSPAILFQFNYTSRGCLTVRWSRFVSAKVTRVTELCAPWLSPSSRLALECPCGDARGSGDHVLVLKAVSGLCLHRIC